MPGRRLTVVAVAATLALAPVGCARTESDTLDAERKEATTSASVSPLASVSPSVSVSPVVEELVVVGEAGFPLTVRVPASWDESGVTDWVVGSGRDAELGRRLTARPRDDPAPASPFPVGATVATSRVFLERYDIPTTNFARFAVKWAEFVAGIDYAVEDPSCDYGGVSDVSRGAAYALLRVWTSCGSGSTTIADVWSADPDTGEVVYGLVVVQGSEVVESARDILGSIASEGEAVLDVDG